MRKLFRRLTAHLSSGGQVSGFKTYLESKTDPINIISTGHFTNFDYVVKVDGNRVDMTVDPEDLVFLS